MTEPPHPFAHDDAAYVLGLLSEEERAAFAAHLGACAACARRVGQLAAMPLMLAELTEDDFAESEPVPMPDTVLAGLLHVATRSSRRRRWVVGGLAGVAAACLLAVALVSSLLVRGTGGGAEAVAMTPVRSTPLSATVAIQDEPWGTRVELDCRYASGGGWSSQATYKLQAIDRAGTVHDLGSWTVRSGAEMTFTSGTQLRRAGLATVQITLPDGTPVLRLTS